MYPYHTLNASTTRAQSAATPTTDPRYQRWRYSGLGHVLEDQARLLGTRTYLRIGDRSFSFEDLHAAATLVAGGLAELGVRQGDKVALMLPNCVEFLASLFALAKLGAVQVPINTSQRGHSLAYILNHSDSIVLIVAEEFVGTIAELARELTRLRRVVVLTGAGRPIDGRLPFETLSFTQLLQSKARIPPVEVRHSDLYAIMYTSGTTGPPKGVMLPHRYPLHAAVALQRILRFAGDDVFYTCLPLFHANAQIMTAIAALVFGVRVAMAERFSASRFWDEVREARATHFYLMGNMLMALWKQPLRPDDAQHGARLTLAAPIPAEIHRPFERRFGLIAVQGYGMTEAVPVLSELPGSDALGSCGRPICGYEVDVVDDDDEPVAIDQPGELVLRPTEPYSMMIGYYKMPEATAAAWRNLYFHTGDLVRRDGQGRCYWLDRKRDSIRRRGENISAWEIETAVNAHPDVAESAAIGVPSEMTEDDVKIVVIRREGATLTPEALIDFLSPRLARYALPRYVEFVETLPRTETQRVQKYILRENWQTPGTWDREHPGVPET